jgi:hypothetical protein
MRFKAVIVKPGLWGLRKSDLRDIGRDAIEAAGKLWHYLFKRRHFTHEAFDLYRYSRRSRKYEARKAKFHPDADGRPLVFTGESERLAMAANVVIAKATTFDKYHADVNVSAPNLNFHAREMTRTTDYEDAAMEEKFAEVFEAGMVDKARARGASDRRIELWQGHLNAA